MNDVRQMEREDKLISKEIKKEMTKIEDLPPPYAWDKISSQLFLAGSASKKKKEPVPWYRSLGFAASVLLIIGIGSSVFFSRFISPEDSVSSPYSAFEMMQIDEYEGSRAPGIGTFSEDFGTETENEITGMADDFAEEPGEPVEDTSGRITDRPHISSPVPGVPDSMSGFFLREVEESVGFASASFFLYTRDDQELWLVVSELNPFNFGDYSGLEGRYIPESSFKGMEGATYPFVVRDNTGNRVMIWMSGNKYYLLWSRSDNIAIVDFLELRSNFPMR